MIIQGTNRSADVREKVMRAWSEATGEGRLVIPDYLRDFAGLGEQAGLIGRGPFVQIWEPEAGQRHQEEAFRRATENRDSIHLAFASKTGGGDGR